MAVRVGYIGSGLSFKVFHFPLTSSLPDHFTPTSLYVNSESSRQAISADKQYGSLTLFHGSDAQMTEMIASVDLVVVCSPPGSHLAHLTKCVEAGKHCIVEKPIAGDSDSAKKIQALAETAKSQGLVISVFQNRRWDSNFLSLRALLRDGRLGRVVSVKSRMDRWRPHAKGNGHWREDPGSGGLLLDLGSHLIDQMVALFGPPTSLSSVVKSQRSGTGSEPSSNDYFCIVMTYANPDRPVVTIEAGSLVSCPHHRFEVHGTQGSWIVDGEDPQEDQIKASMSPLADGFGQHPNPATLYLAQPDGSITAQEQRVDDGTWIKYYEGIAASIAKGDGVVQVPVSDAVACLEILERAKEMSLK